MDDYLYFFIYFPRSENVDINKDIRFEDIEDENESKTEKPECIYQVDTDYDKENQKYYYKMIFKAKKIASKKNYYFEFEISDDKYIISFETNEKTIFIYDVTLQVGIRIIDIKKFIPQNQIEYQKKFGYFKDALEKIKETNKVDKLYKDTIDLFSQKKGFDFLIFLFLEIYKKRELCIELMANFRKMCSNQKGKENNMDRKKDLESYSSTFNDIITKEAINLTEDEDYKYNPIDFYGIILCYLNYYNYNYINENENFTTELKKTDNEESENFCGVLIYLYRNKPNDLYEILLIYHYHFLNPIIQNFEFFNSFITYCISSKDFPTFLIGLSYIKNIDIFINVIEKNKKKIYDKYINIKSNKSDEKFIIKLDKNLKLKKSGTYKKIPDYILNILSIIEFSIDKEIFFINFTKDFWKYLLNCFNEPILDNIPICYKLRQIFIKYHDILVTKIFTKLFCKKETKLTKSIKKDANDYFQIDEPAILLDQMIMEYINKNKNQENIEKLTIIKKYNPYYIDPKYSNKVNPDIFDLVDLDNIDESFIKQYRVIQFEFIFKDNLYEYIAKITSKIKTINNFDIAIQLINIQNFIDIEKKSMKKNEDKNKNIIIFLNSLNKKYDDIIEEKIKKLSGKDLDEAIKVVVKLILMNYTYEKQDKKLDFIKKKIIKKLPKNIKTDIFIEIIRQYINNNEKINKDKDNENIDYKGIIEFIFDEFANRLENNDDIDNVIKLIDCLECNKEKIESNDEMINQREALVNEFLNKLFEKNLFNKEEFFTLPKREMKISVKEPCRKNNQPNIKEPNIRILLLYKLKENVKKRENEDFYDKIVALLKIIDDDLSGKIRKKKLEEFLENSDYKEIIINRFSLIDLFKQIKPKDLYDELTKKIEKINNDIEILKRAKTNLLLYFKKSQKELLNKLIEFIKENENKQIGLYSSIKIGELIEKCDNLKEEFKKIDEIKDFLLFNIIHETMDTGNDDKTNFTKAVKKLDNISELINEKKGINDIYKDYKEVFKKIISKCNNEERANEFIKKFKDYYGLNENNLDEYKKDLIDDLTILFKSEKFKLDIDSIIFFFDCFYKDNDRWNQLFYYKVNGKEESLSIDKNDDFQAIKNKLLQLKKNKIYDYQEKEKCNRLFTCLYDKKEAIEFLFSKINASNEKNIAILKDRIDPTNTTINSEDIDNTIECINIVAKMKKKSNNFEIYKFIKQLDEKDISYFVNYSKKYPAIIELDRYYDPSENIFEQVKKKIEKELTLNISQEADNFIYHSKETNRYENITFEDLIKLKNKIPPKNENNKTDEEKKKSVNSKSDVLIFFKNIISNLEIILQDMNDLKNKGSNLPIKICIKVKDMNKLDYYLGGQKVKNFDVIKTFLSEVKNKYNSQLNSLYKENAYLRFLFGKHFIAMMKHLQSTFSIDSFLRYILNNIDNDSKIKEGYKTVKEDVVDYIDFHELYNKYSLESISMYIADLFTKNNKTLEIHYNKMKIRGENYKGIYLYECTNNSKEEFIINLFWDKITELPIAQNLLITNKETSTEEMQAFFHRSILCNYNTLFVVEISDSISEYQQSIMNTYINQLLSYKKEKYNEENKEKVDKKDASIYLDSCIVFVYDKYNRNIKSFQNEMNKINKKNFKNNEYFKERNDAKKEYLSELGNITVYSSEICGLGKTGKIRSDIKKAKKKYYHFPLGGILSKKTIFNKLESLLNKIKKENFKDAAIHLDLTESEEKSILNEFFFSFLITKFYSNNESIIYIPKDISIYVEIPNCFEKYLDQFDILKIFKNENITFDSIPKFNVDMIENIKNTFYLMLENESEEKIENFIKKNIGINKYSYHQINIFIKLFVSQYSTFKWKLSFNDNGKDTTEKCIEEFANCTKYFTNGGFAQLLTGEYKSKNIDFDKKDYIDKLSEVYKDDLNGMNFNTPLIFIIKEKKIYNEIFIPSKINPNEFKKYKNSKDYLQRLKEVLDLPDKIEDLMSIIEGKGENDNNYVITNDNFKKMLLLIYRIKANVPVIIMGDTGCGKTSLITKLNQLLNSGKNTMKIINIHPGIDDEKLIGIMKEIEKEIQGKKVNEELWLFFDEINTCPSLSLITEIFINRTYNGNKINENIRLIGACNPYRKRKEGKEKCGLSFSDDNENELIYLVNPLPQSLLYYVFSFGSLEVDDEKKYIYSIIEKLFLKEKEELKSKTKYKEIQDKCDKLKKEKNKIIKEYDEKINQKKEKEKEILKQKIDIFDEQIEILENELRNITTVDLHVLTTEAILQCHIYLREAFDESVVSLREIARFPKLVEFFLDYFKKKNLYENRANNEKNNMLRSIICSIYLCYYIRLPDDNTRNNFETKLRGILLELINNEKTQEDSTDLSNQIKNQDFKNEINSRETETIEKNFSDFLKIEQDYLIEQIKPEKGIGKNSLLKESTFLLFVSVITNIPLIIIGKPGTGKSLSVQLINKSLKGKYSNKKFFRLYPKLIQTYFQGSKSTKPEDVDILFEKTRKKLQYYIKNKLEPPISMACFDELGLAERSKYNPLKALHPRLDYTGKNNGESFVGISNYSLDAAKLNRALVLSVPDLDKKFNELINTARNIVESISPKIKGDKIFEILSRTYYYYKELLRKIKELVVLKKYIYEKCYKLISEENQTPKNLMKLNINKVTNKKDKEKEGDISTNFNNDTFFEKKKSISITSENSKSPKYHESSKSVIMKKISEMFNGNFKSDEEKKMFKEWGILKGNFQAIKLDKEFKYLMKKENKIRIDFHGNRDFYNLIKGIAYALGISGELGDPEKVKKIVKFIERNFGGIEYDIDIDFNLRLDDIKNDLQKIQDIIQDYDKENKKQLKLTSVFLFKKLYNLEWDKEKEDSISNLKILNEELNDYNINNCINDNINDFGGRYLLLEITQSLTPLIIQNIKLENPSKDENIVLYDGSPFPDDNNDEYRFKKIIKIHGEAQDNKLIIIENLNQIHPFLFDLYNMNYEIINDEKYARICLDSFKELKTKVNDNFRIIIIVDKSYADVCDLAFLNRLEKINLSFDKLLDKELNLTSRQIIEVLDLKRNIDRISEINYSLKDLLINCRDQEIKALIYYYSKVSKINDDESEENENRKNKIKDQIKKNVINKIYKILPQDIISILPEDNEIFKKYESKNVYNFSDYIKNEENKKFKISIIYTFTNIANTVEELNADMNLMISEIRSESEFKRKIEEKKNVNEYNKNDNKYIYIHFERSNSKNIKFVSYFILENFLRDNFNYILIIHINRNFNNNKIEKIYSLPDINDEINQIFIDDLNGNREIKLKDLLSGNLKYKLNLNEKFDITLENYLKVELEEKRKDFDEDNIKEYIEEIKNYMKEEPLIKDKIIVLAYKLIDDFKKNESDQGLVEKIYKEKYVNQFTTDIISCLVEYIKEEIFIKNLKKAFQILEDNNILTTIIEIKKRKYKDLNKIIVKDIVDKYLDQINFEKNYYYSSKFLFNYNIPGFYNFYITLSNFINENITLNYFNNEKKIRGLANDNPTKLKEFHDIEKSSIDIVYGEINKKHKFIFEFMNKIPEDLILKDYITYFLQKYRNNDVIYKIDDIYHKIIELLLILRFNPENELVKEDNKLNILIIKIIWIESNTNYILNILKIIENSTIIFNNNESALYDKIEELYKEDKIKYITKPKRNPDDTKEVNQCFYILLAIICYCVTSDEIQMEINYYCDKLKEINKILQILNDELYIYLNEMYIIDELIKVIEIFKKNNDIEKINIIQKKLVENAELIQQYSNKENQLILSENLTKNFEELYNLINIEQIYKKNKDSYEKFRYILFKEIKKINDISYRCIILNKLLEQKEMIKKSTNIFQIVLRNYLDKDEFKNNINNIENANDEIVQLIEKKLNDNIILEETLLYLFEKNSINYYNNILNKKAKQTNLEDEPLQILKDCVKFLDNFINNQENNDLKEKVKELGKLFCIGYIKTFCYIFIKMIEGTHQKLKKHEDIIKVFNYDKPICKMIRLYIYKILYNKYNINFFNSEIMTKYKLKSFKDYDELMKVKDLTNNIYKLDFKVKTLKNEDYGKFYESLKDKYNKDKYNTEINSKYFDIRETRIDNFYIASYNLILANLLNEKKDFNKNFWNNVCRILFKNDELILKALQLFYDPDKYGEIQKDYNINSKNIRPILYGYRYCLNELSLKKTKGIYYPFYSSDDINFLKKNLYPGNDTKLNTVYYNIINHFKNKPDEGCYICLCQNFYYHSVPSGFPGIQELNKSCPNCKKNIGSFKREKDIIIVKRDDYYRIFKDQKDIKELKKDSIQKDKLDKINYMTLKDFEEKFIIKSYKNEKGVFVPDINSFKSDKKIVRNLSQISFRILNYILYTHLFFARIITDQEGFDNYKPDGMKWEDLLSESWNIIKEELLKINIDSTEQFMHFIFTEVFSLLNNENYIDNYDNLINLEDKLEKKIQNLIKDYEENDSNNDLIEDEDITSYINLLKERFNADKYKKEEFPLYNFFYYTDYLDERYISEKINYMVTSKYPVLKMYLEYKNNNKPDKYKDIINNINLFNDTLNLLSQKYFNNISKEDAKNKDLTNEEIYINNKEKFDQFIEFYDNLQIDEIENKEKLKDNRSLSNFFIREDNNFGKNYKIIYKTFINQQNDKINLLLEQKGIDCDNQNKANIQQLDEKEIFTLDLPKKVLFNNILFDSSYRKILDKMPVNYNSYKEYVINYDYIEEIMTEYLLSNKKLLNENIIEFIYNNELFSNKVTNLFNLFTKRYICKKEITISEKIIIYKYCDSNKNIHIYKKVIIDFMKLIKFLNDKRKENYNPKDDDFKEETPIIELLKEANFDYTDEFKALFNDNESLKIDQIYAIFEYYLKAIYVEVNPEIKQYQVELDEDLKKKINDYFKKGNFIEKEDLCHAIRLFITLVLLLEDDKKNKIKDNKNNIINYLKSEDLWIDVDIKNKQFIKNMNDLKSMNIHINQIVYLYEELGKDIKDDFFSDVISKLKEKPPEIVEDSTKKVKEPEDLEEQEEEEEEEEKEEKKDE